MIPADQLQALVALLFAHSWVAASAVFAGLVVRVLKDDRVPVPLDKRWRPALSAGVGMLCGALNAAVAGAPLLPSLALGFLAGAVAVLGHVFGIELLLGGKELFAAPKDDAVEAEDDDDEQGPPTARGAGASKLALVMAIAAAALLWSGCAAVAKVVTAVATEVAKTSTALNTIEAFVRAFFATSPDPEREELVLGAIDRARSALLAAEHAASGTENLTQDRIDAAFENFRRAWVELEQLVAGMPGLRIVGAGEPAMDMTVAGDVIVVRPALAEEPAAQ